MTLAVLAFMASFLSNAENSAEWRQNCALKAEAGSELANYREAAAALDKDAKSLSAEDLKRRSVEILKKYGGFSEVQFAGFFKHNRVLEANQALFIATQLENIMVVTKARDSKDTLANGFVNMKGTLVGGSTNSPNFKDTAQGHKVNLVFDSTRSGIQYSVAKEGTGLVSTVTTGDSRSMHSDRLQQILFYALGETGNSVDLSRVNFRPDCKKMDPKKTVDAVK